MERRRDGEIRREDKRRPAGLCLSLSLGRESTTIPTYVPTYTRGIDPLHYSNDTDRRPLSRPFYYISIQRTVQRQNRVKVVFSRYVVPIRVIKNQNQDLPLNPLLTNHDNNTHTAFIFYHIRGKHSRIMDYLNGVYC